MFVTEIDTLIKNHLKHCALQIPTVEESDAKILTSLLNARLMAEDSGYVKPSVATQTETQKTHSESEPVAAEPEAPAYTFDGDIKPMVMKLAQIDRQKCLDIFAELKVSKAGDLQPDQFAVFMQKANAIVENHKKADG